MKITQHIPGFVDIGDDEPDIAEYTSTDELLAAPFVKRWATVKPGFYRFSLSRDQPRPYLMAEFDEGRTWYVVGFMDGDFPDMPEWKPSKKRRQHDFSKTRKAQNRA